MSAGLGGPFVTYKKPQGSHHRADIKPKFPRHCMKQKDNLLHHLHWTLSCLRGLWSLIRYSPHHTCEEKDGCVWREEGSPWIKHCSCSAPFHPILKESPGGHCSHLTGKHSLKEKEGFFFYFNLHLVIRILFSRSKCDLLELRVHCAGLQELYLQAGRLVFLSRTALLLDHSHCCHLSGWAQ